MMRAYLFLLLAVVAAVFGVVPVASAADEGFVPQTSSTRTDIPSPAVLPAAGAKHMLTVFVSATGIGYVGHKRLKRKQS